MTQHAYQPFMLCDNYGARDEPTVCEHQWYQSPHCVLCLLPQADEGHTADSMEL